MAELEVSRVRRENGVSGVYALQDDWHELGKINRLIQGSKLNRAIITIFKSIKVYKVIEIEWVKQGIYCSLSNLYMSKKPSLIRDNVLSKLPTASDKH